MVANRQKKHRPIIAELEYNPMPEIYGKSPEFLKLTAEFMCFQAGMKGGAPKDDFPLFGQVFYTVGEFPILSGKFRGVDNPHQRTSRSERRILPLPLLISF